MEPEAWVNAFLGRIFWDFLGEKYWANLVSKKIQMKLSKIRVGCGTRLHKCLYKTKISGWQSQLDFMYFLLFSFEMSSVFQLPYVMNELTLTELDMGFSTPKILHASKPSVDHQGRKRLFTRYGMFVTGWTGWSSIMSQPSVFPWSPPLVILSQSIYHFTLL